MKTTINRFRSIGAALAMAALTLAGCQKDDPQNQPIDYDNLRFEVTVGEKTDYEGDTPDTRAVKQGWEQNDMIIVHFDGSDANKLWLKYDTEDGWVRTDNNNITSLKPEGGTAQALHTNSLRDDYVGKDMLFTDAGTYTMDGNTVRLTLPMNTRITSRVTVETSTFPDWMLAGPDLSVRMESTELADDAFSTTGKWADALATLFEPSDIGTSKFTGYGNFTSTTIEFFVIDRGTTPGTTFHMHNLGNGKSYSRTYSDKELTPGKAVIIQGPESAEADQWTLMGGGDPDTTTPTSWDDVQSIVDGMSDGDTIDLSGLTDYPDNTDSPASGITKTITVAKDITITAQMDPVSGKFGNGTLYSGFNNVHFVLAGNPTVTFDKIRINESRLTEQPLISGEGNVIAKEVSFGHSVPINVEGDVSVYGTIAELLHDNVSHTTQIVAQSSLFANYAQPAIKAHNVIVEGGTVSGGLSFDGSSYHGNGSMAISASGNVTIKGELKLFTNPDRYLESAYISGGSAQTDGYGGYAIRASGKVTIDGGVFVRGGNGAGEGEIGGTAIQPLGGLEITGEYIRSAFSNAYFPTARISGGDGINGGNGGHGIDAAGGIAITGGVYVTGGDGSGGAYSTGGYGIVAADCDVTLKGEKYDPGDGYWFSLRVRSGNGDYSTGTPFRFQGDPGIVRTLTATTAQISDVNATTYCAPFAMDLKENDQAILDDCRLGWYTSIPLFSGGYYKITNPLPLDTWGTNANATPLEGNEWVPNP